MGQAKQELEWALFRRHSPPSSVLRKTESNDMLRDLGWAIQKI